jgi:hypothetical protein
MKKIALFALILCFALLSCDTGNEDTFVESTNDNVSNNVDTLGLAGTSASSSNTDVATVVTPPQEKIVITSVGAGSAEITVSDGDDNAKINITVSETGSITVGEIVRSKNGSIDFSEAKKYDAVNGDGTDRSYDKCAGLFSDNSADLSTVFANSSYTVSISATNKVTLQMGTPNSTVLYSSSIIGTAFEISAGLQIYEIGGFRYGHKPAPSICWEHETNPDNSISFIYANKDGTISGTDTSYADGTYTLMLDLELKQGWNTALLTFNNKEITMVTGKPTSSYKWRTGTDTDD